MKLLEFFSKNNKEEENENIEHDLEKEVMGFILDDDDIYKERLLPIITKLQKGVKVAPEEFMDTVNHACLEYYKEEDFKKDPNEIFPIAMRRRLAKNLLVINTKGLKKDKQDENKRRTP
jgi:hypothetical protein